METQTEAVIVKPSNELARERTDWASSRTRLAAERTMMAVLRTGLSFIGFGFTIFKFLQYVRESGGAGSPIRAHGPRNMGLALIGIGLFVLAVGSWQHWMFLKQLQSESDHKFPWSVSLTGSLILGTLGVVAFLTLVVRMGPLSK
jgi:putative membrane protein